MSLRVYNRKRNFGKTPEPPGKLRKGKGLLRFVVQMHRATRLHYDFRLEFGGVFRSWAVPKGPSLSPLDQRLAVFVEDHPIDYGSFEGIIPKGNYGAGTVMLWDEGTYVERGSKSRKDSEAAMMKAFEKGHITFVLTGTKLKGEFALIKLKKSVDDKAWIMVKKRDEFSSFKRDQVLDNSSVKTGRSIDEIAKQSLSEGDVWLPKKGRVKPEKKIAKKAVLAERPTKQTATKQIAKPVAKSAVKADPMPRKNKPMLATSSRNFTAEGNWIFEPEQKGLRAIAEVEGKRVHLYSRAGLSFEKKFSKIVESLKSLNHVVVLDGEIVTTGKEAHYVVFDILYFDGRDLRKEPLSHRKQILGSAGIEAKFVKLVENAKLSKGSHVVAKNLDSHYRSGTSTDWLIVNEVAISAPQKKTVSIKKLPETKKSLPTRSKAMIVDREEPRLTNLDKVFWPKEGYTKGDLIEYYRKIAPYILPYLKDRPESLNRQPNGIAAAGFYQKDMTGHIPKWLKTTRYFSESADRSIDYVLCQDERSLLYIVNLGCIEVNPWFSRVNKPDHPDFMVIDLDPDGNSFDHVIEIAHEVRKILEKVGAKSFCKTSGATGIHIGVPTGARYDFDEVRAFAESICRIIAKKYPATTSVERSPNRRRGKIYLDFMQNRRGQTLAAPFCVRPKPKAPISMPLTWRQLRPGLRPEDFTIKNAPQLIAQFKEDPWRGVLGEPINLSKCVKALKKIIEDSSL